LGAIPKQNYQKNEKIQKIMHDAAKLTYNGKTFESFLSHDSLETIGDALV